MEFEYWWLLALPLFFGLGWVAARIDIRHLVSESRALPRSYFKGLNFLLNEQPDKAIESFIEVVKVDPETVELHFALGSLFRRRGEYDRAIRMHQNLVERPNLGAEQKLAAMFALAQDYLKAGILDRAEALFARLEEGPHAAEARGFLLDIFQQEKDWERAIDMARRLQRDSGESRAREISQFLCELAASEATHSRPDAARAHLEAALEENRKSVRASVALGDLERAAGKLERAIGHWQRVEQQNPAYLALVAQRLLEAYRALGRLEEGLTLLAGYLERYPSLDLLDTAFQTTMEARGAEAAYKLVRDELRRNPTLLGLDRLLEAQIVADTHPERRRDLEQIRNLVHSHTRRLARYRCEVCGFKARQFYWHCPACGGWESYPPRRTEEFELTP
ncbi:MAG: lipopolysaccharide assembly protein LapB [Betaproteobacteria bacterium]|nr:lipopolysaccharide assembly protein LapB [Betaproteobacteria bacterium]MDH5351612.1 lipopolysaccharide assembly protein LapB [Betaproteobacteria bacterium]